MKNILLIGLGRFGKHIAMEMNNLGHEIMAVDNNEERVNAALPFVTNAQIGDSTNLSASIIMTCVLLQSAEIFRTRLKPLRF